MGFGGQEREGGEWGMGGLDGWGDRDLRRRAK
jgi:hypothetical protein